MWRNSCRGTLGAAALASSLALLAACAQLTVAQEQQLGARMARDMRAQLRMLHDRTVNAYVQSIGERIIQAAGPQPFEYTFLVVVDPEINAFAAPGGYVYVNTGTILAARDVSELAGVIAHEIGHVVRRHVSQKIAQQRSTNVVYQAAAVVAGIFGGGGAYNLTRLGGGLAAMGVMNSFGREAERESDEFAVSVLPAAGYDPHGLVSFFQTIQEEDPTSIPTFASSHPATGDRIANTRALIAALPPNPDLIRSDRGRLQIIQRRIQLLTGQALPKGELEPL